MISMHSRNINNIKKYVETILLLPQIFSAMDKSNVN